MSIERNIQYTPFNKNNCDVTAFQEIDVCVPITVEPYVDLGEPIIDCIEEPYLIQIPCGSWDKKKRKCRFTICQKLSIMIPIEFYVDACSGPVSVNCLDGEEEEEDECQRPPFICCGNEERPSFDLPDFYYYVKNKRGKLKK
ncbi:MAG TPA: hypothetical protein DC024_02415 [Clostridiales bacterium]|jgi:hypothetical protein|nr:hypothetical protein [Clostridiales bacterium]